MRGDDWKSVTLRDLWQFADDTGVLPAEVERRLRFGTSELTDKWNLGSQDPDAFYAHETGDSYIYDLTAWHTGGSITTWFTLVDIYLGQFCKTGARVLDYGAGIGTYSLIAATLGLKVDACDVNATLRGYIDRRAKYHSLSVNTTDAPSGKYQAIICIDTIEHLAHPEDFPAMARSMLEEGGILIATWTFHTSDGVHPMHHDQDRLDPFLLALRENFEGPLTEDWPHVFRALPKTK